jgi:phage gp36-like protein
MSYATLADLLLACPRNELIQLTDYNAEGEVNEAVVTDVGEEADAWLDGYIAKRRATPVSPVPTPLKAMAVRARTFFLHLRRRSVTDDLKAQHEDDRKWLEDYAVGKGSLGDADDPAAPPEPKFEADERVFTRDTMRGF